MAPELELFLSGDGLDWLKVSPNPNHSVCSVVVLAVFPFKSPFKNLSSFSLTISRGCEQAGTLHR